MCGLRLKYMNMKKTILLAVMLLRALASDAQIFTAKSGEASFFSSAPLENIVAKTTSVNSVLNAGTRDIAFIIPMISFRFENALMQEHFNEKYVESHKFPQAKFKGNIKDAIDFTKDGVYPVTVTGILTIHGVEKALTVKGIITIKGGEISAECAFYVSIKDHKIEIPTLMAQKIAETVEVKIKSTYIPYKK